MWHPKQTNPLPKDTWEGQPEASVPGAECEGSKGNSGGRTALGRVGGHTELRVTGGRGRLALVVSDSEPESDLVRQLPKIPRLP